MNRVDADLTDWEFEQLHKDYVREIYNIKNAYSDT